MGKDKDKDKEDKLPDIPPNSQEIWKRHFQAVHEEKIGKKTTRTRVLLVILLLAALATRLVGLGHPHQVVFDEVHFGKFASHYLRGRFFFDVHPPLGKMFIALCGHLAGFKGTFAFRFIGENFPYHVPIVALRMSSALPGALMVPLVFWMLLKLGHSEMAALLSASMILLDNALVCQSRFIFLDWFMMFWIFASVYCWVSFKASSEKSASAPTQKNRKFKKKIKYFKSLRPFSLPWWCYLLGTGVCFTFATLTKFVGIFTVVLIGMDVLRDLWSLLSWRHRLSMMDFLKHFLARLLCLVLIPGIIYTATFYAHFRILYKSGPGDVLMSPSFQSTLERNPISSSSPRMIAYGSLIVLRHDNSFHYLHSHRARYPLRYPDGRISSQGQQIIAAEVQGPGSWWMVLPNDEFLDFQDHTVFVKNGDIIQLQHYETGAFLYAHDVASPLHPQFMEIVADSPSISIHRGRGPGSRWKIEIVKGATDLPFQVLSSTIRLQHLGTNSHLTCQGKTLPEWGLQQFEVSGNKEKSDDNNFWTVESHLNRFLTQFIEFAPPAGFWEKFYEIHEKMYLHNAHLMESHKYQSLPISWPFMLRGVKFWDGEKNQQIYLLGNPFIWGLAIYCGVASFAVLYVITFLREHRGHYDFEMESRKRFRSSGLLFFLGWLLNFVPFFFMDRTLYLHHYFPSLIFSILLTGVVFDFICESLGDRDAQLYTSSILIGLFIIGFYLFSPLTFGTLSTPEDLHFLRWLKTWDFKVVD